MPPLQPSAWLKPLSTICDMLHHGGREADWLRYRDIKVYMERKPYKHTAPPAHDDDDDNHIQPGLTLRHSHMLTMHFTLLLHSNTRMLCKKNKTNNELTWIPSSLRSQAVDSCPTSRLLWSIWWVYLLFITIWGQHQWDTKTLNPCVPMRGEAWRSILCLFVICFVDLSVLQ